MCIPLSVGPNYTAPFRGSVALDMAEEKKFAARRGQHLGPPRQQSLSHSAQSAQDDDNKSLQALFNAYRKDKARNPSRKGDEEGVALVDDEEAVPLAKLRDFTNKKKKKKQKHKVGTKTKRDGVRPCSQCIHAAIGRCGRCYVDLRAMVRPPVLHVARRTATSFELMLKNDLGLEVRLCSRCIGDCSSTYEQLGKEQWEKALGTAAHYTKCDPSRHPKVGELSAFKRRHLSALRKDKAAYSQSSRRGFARQQKTLGEMTPNKNEKSKMNLAHGRPLSSTPRPQKAARSGTKSDSTGGPPGPHRKQKSDKASLDGDGMVEHHDKETPRDEPQL